MHENKFKILIRNSNHASGVSVFVSPVGPKYRYGPLRWRIWRASMFIKALIKYGITVEE